MCIAAISPPKSQCAHPIARSPPCALNQHSIRSAHPQLTLNSREIRSKEQLHPPYKLQPWRNA